MSVGWAEVVVGACECFAAGSAGWWLHSSPALRAAVASAKGYCAFCPEGLPAPTPAATAGTPGRGGPLFIEPSWRGSRQLWALVMAGGAAAVACAGSVGQAGRTSSPGRALAGVAWLGAWAALAALLGLVDWQQNVVPTRFARGASLVSASLCIATCTATGDWVPFVEAATCATAAWALFGVCAVLWPARLGFGDARMAFLVAFGAGATGAGGAFVALACAPLTAGAAGKWSRRNRGKAVGPKRRACQSAAASTVERGPAKNSAGGATAGGPRATPLAPFLALAGIAAVVAHGG
jgi:hypothetical protein